MDKNVLTLSELAGRLLAVKTIYGESYEEYIRAGTEKGDWIHQVMIEELDLIYNGLVELDNQHNH